MQHVACRDLTPFSSQGDLVAQSQGQILNEDIVPIPLYQPAFKYSSSPWPTLNQMIDGLKWTLESQLPLAHFALSQKVMATLSSYQIQSPTRPIVGMGYSGGFYPLVEAIAARRFNVQSLVALGAATFNFNQDVVSVFLKVFGYAQNWLIDRIQPAFVDAITPLLKAIGTTQAKMNEILDRIQADDVTGTINRLVERFTEENETRRSLLPSLAGTSVQRIVNVWGTKDVLYNAGVAGKRIDLSDKPTSNIEIIGATHFDYTRRTPKPNEDMTWNETVANFVTELIRFSDSDQHFADFTALNVNKMVFDSQRQVWVVKLPGWETR